MIVGKKSIVTTKKYFRYNKYGGIYKIYMP